jgi:hypothetical protein
MPPPPRFVHPAEIPEEELLELFGYGPESGRRPTPEVLAEIAELKARPPLPPLPQIAAEVWVMLALRPRTLAAIAARVSECFGHAVAAMVPDALATLETEDRAEYDTGEALWWALWKGARIMAAEVGDEEMSQ